MRSSNPLVSRRHILSGAVAAAGLACLKPLAASGEERPAVQYPRATSGDDVVEPDWKERIVVTVGPKDADLVGASEKVLQAAVDYVARLGGGTVKIFPAPTNYGMRCTWQATCGSWEAGTTACSSRNRR
jgi:hypothetical protein